MKFHEMTMRDMERLEREAFTRAEWQRELEELESERPDLPVDDESEEIPF